MEITHDYIDRLLVKVNTWFRESIDHDLDVSNPSMYTIKPVHELPAFPSYSEIWNKGEQLSAEQVAEVLYNNAGKYNFWDFQLVSIQSASMCIIVFLNHYPQQTGLDVHSAFPQEFSPMEYLKKEYGDSTHLLQTLLKRRTDLII